MSRIVSLELYLYEHTTATLTNTPPPSPSCLSSEILLPINFPLNKLLSLKVEPHYSCERADSDSLHKTRKQESTRSKDG